MPPDVDIFSDLKHIERHSGRRFAIIGTSVEMESIYRGHEFSKSEILWPVATALALVLHDNCTYRLLGGTNESDIMVVGTVCEYRD